jgi:hypothetical protein
VGLNVRRQVTRCTVPYPPAAFHFTYFVLLVCGKEQDLYAGDSENKFPYFIATK